jgi:archaellum component FlaF (FlaF/FlaG flagellin family)
LDLSVKSFNVPKDKTNIYVVRGDLDLEAETSFQVILDGRLMDDIKPGSYLLFETPPGDHVVSVFTNENQESVSLETEEGKNYFLEVEPLMGVWTARATIKQIEENAGREAVMHSNPR